MKETKGKEKKQQHIFIKEHNKIVLRWGNIETKVGTPSQRQNQRDKKLDLQTALPTDIFTNIFTKEAVKQIRLKPKAKLKNVTLQ